MIVFCKKKHQSGMSTFISSQSTSSTPQPPPATIVPDEFHDTLHENERQKGQ